MFTVLTSAASVASPLFFLLKRLLCKIMSLQRCEHQLLLRISLPVLIIILLSELAQEGRNGFGLRCAPWEKIPFVCTCVAPALTNAPTVVPLTTDN